MSNGNFDYVGALWLKEGKKGKYFSGEVELNNEKVRVLVFKNTNKKEDKHPDYNICVPKESSKQQDLPEEPNVFDDNDDIPF